MELSASLLMELEHETGNTRRALERVDESKLDWKPHEKSLTLRQLASHIAELPSWTDTIINQHVFELETGSFEPFSAANKAELLEACDSNLAVAREALAGTSDATLMEPWQMKVDGELVVDMPKVAVLRAWVLSHVIHHRGQLTVYLRLTDQPVPAIYGSSADEQG